MSLFDLAARISLDSSGYEKGIDNASGTIKGFAGKLKSGLGKAAKIGGAAIGAVATQAGALGGAVFKTADNVAAFGDNIDKMSQKMGLSAERYQEWDFILQHSGTSMESLKAGMKTLATAAETGNSAFQKLGISQEQMASMSQEELFDATLSGLQNVTDETERTYLAGQLLGRGATELGALLNTSAEDTEAMRQQVHDLGGVMSNDAVKAAAQFKDSLQNLQTAFGGLKRGLTEDFLPAMSTVMDGLALIFSGDESGIGLVSDGIGNIVSTLSEKIPEIIATATQLATDLLPVFAESAVSIVEGLASGLSENGEALILSAVEVIGILLAGIVENAPEIINAAIPVIASLAEGLAEQLPTLIPQAVEMVITLMNGLIQNAPLLVNAALNLITSLANGLITALPIFVAQAPVLIANLISTIITQLPLIIKTGIQLIIQLGIGLIRAIPQLVSNVPRIISSLKSAFGNIASQMLSIGGDVVRGIWNGISNGLGWIKTQITGWVGNVKDFLKNLFGIASPSKWARDQIGRFLVQGIGVGITTDKSAENAFKKKFNALNSLASGEIAKTKIGLNTDFSLSSTSNVEGDSAGARIATTIINVYQTINAEKMTAAELEREAKYQAKRAVL